MMHHLAYRSGNDTRAVRIVMREDQPWFVLADVCTVLEIKNNRNVSSRLDDDQKSSVRLMDGTEGNPNITIISESGLWAVILGARKNPKTKPFQDWVTREVLPAIRKTGTYTIPTPEPQLPQDPLSLALKAALETREALLIQDKKLVVLEESINILEERMGEERIRSEEISKIFKLGQQLGRLMGGYDKAWRLFKDRFDLASYRDLKRQHFADGVRFLERQIGAYSDSVHSAQERLVSP